MTEIPSRLNSRPFARRIAFYYLIGASAWIFLSDLALSELTVDLQAHTAYGVVKGVLFVFLTTALLYWVLSIQARSIDQRAAAAPALSASSRSLWRTPVAAFGAMGIAVLFAAIFMFTLESRQHRQAARDLLESMLVQESSELQTWLASKRAVARSYQGARALREQVVALDRHDDKLVRADLAARLEGIRQNLEVDAVLMLDSKARLIAAAGAPRFSVLSGQFSARASDALRAGDIQTAFLHRGGKGDGDFVFIDDIVPFPGKAPGQPSPGALVLREDAYTRFFKMIRNVHWKSRSAEALLVRRDGDQVLFLSDLRFRENAALQFKLPLSNSNLPATLAVQGAHLIEGTDYRGVEVVAAAQAIPGTDWFLIAKIDRDEVLGPVQRSVLNWLLAIAGIGTLAAFGVVTLWRQQRAVAALREQALKSDRKALEKHLDLMSRYANDVILLFGNDGRVIEANERVADMYGYSQAEIAGMNISRLRLPREESDVAQRMERIWRTGSDVYEALHVRRDGRTFPVEISSRRIDVGAERYIQTIIRDVSARKAAEAALRESQHKLALFIEHAPAAIAMLDVNMCYIAASKRWFTDYGLGIRAIVGRSHYEVFSDIPERWKEIHRRCLAGASEQCEADSFIRSDGRTEWVHWEIRPWRRSDGAIGGLIMFTEVITEREQARARIKRLAEAHDALSAVNRTIVRVNDEDELYREICDVIVARAGFRVAWIGLVDRSARLVRPVAQAGDAEAYVSALHIPFDDDHPEGRSLVEQAIRGGEPVIVQDIANDPHEAVWHDGARRWQLGSMAIIPLRRDATVIGALNVYAREPGAFDEEHVKLLREMGDDVSFALGTIARNRELRESEARFRAMMEQSVAATYVIQEGRIAYVNPRMRELFGYGPDEPFDPDPLAHVAPSDRARVADQMTRRLQSGRHASYSFNALRRDGAPFTFGISAQFAPYLAKPAIIAIGQDITEKERAEAERSDRLRRVEAHLAALASVTGSEHLSSGDVEKFARELTEAAANAVGVERANVWLFNDSETELRCIDLYEATAARHSSGATLAQENFGPEFAALKSAVYVDANEPLTDPRTAGYAESYLKPLRITSMLDAVVRFAGKNLGLLCLEHVDRPHDWHQDEIAFACQLADKLALAVVNRRRRRAQAKLRRSLEASIEAIAATVEMRDPYTAGHERRVAELAAAIATEMALPPFMVEGIHFGAMIHDLGKIQVPAEILSKPSRLSPVEFELIKGHAQSGYEILKGIDFPWPVADMARQHHERLDGSGYPQGLKGDQILLEARVLAVADTVEAMASHRPYRPGLGIDKALAEIERGRGSAYDALVVDACLHLFRDKGYQLPA